MYSSVLRSLTARRTAHYYDFCKQFSCVFFHLPWQWNLGFWEMVCLFCKFMLIIFWSINTCNNYVYLQMTTPSLQCSIFLLTFTGLRLSPYWVSWCLQLLTNLSLLFVPATYAPLCMMFFRVRKPFWLLITIGIRHQQMWKCCRRSLTSVGRPWMWNPWCQSFRGPLSGSW